MINRRSAEECSLEQPAGAEGLSGHARSGLGAGLAFRWPQESGLKIGPIGAEFIHVRGALRLPSPFQFQAFKINMFLQIYRPGSPSMLHLSCLRRLLSPFIPH